MPQTFGKLLGKEEAGHLRCCGRATITARYIAMTGLTGVKHGFILFLLPCLLQTIGLNQESPVPPARAGNATKPESDRQAENAAASLFDAARRNAGLHGLGRIKDRKSLQQLVCTISITDKVPTFQSGVPILGIGIAKNFRPPSALYRTAKPDDITPELERVALFVRAGHGRGYARYAVAVWPAQRTAPEKREYWVGVQLYWSAGSEFF